MSIRPLLRTPLFALAWFGLMVAGVTAAWILADDALQSFMDAAHHHIQSLHLSRTLRQQGLGGAWDVLVSGHVAWPPGLFALHGGAAYLLGEGFHAMRLTNLMYIPALLWVVYALGRRWGDARTATLAAALSVSSLGVAFHLRHICIDNPAVVLVPLAMLALTRVARDPRASTWLLFGAACGLGLLFRVQVVFFVAAPAVAVAAWSLKSAGSRGARLRLLGWMALSALVALVVSSPYWAARPQLFITEALSHVGIHLPYQGLAHEQGPTHQFGLGSGVAYYALTTVQIVGWPVVLVVAGTLPRLLRRRPRAVLLLLCAAGGFLAHAATISREPRYLLPAVPALSLLAALGLEQLSRRARVILTVVLLLGTTGTTLWVAGHGWRVEPRSWQTWFFHNEHARPPHPNRRPQVASVLGAALRGHIAQQPAAPARMLLIARSLEDERKELFVHLAPHLPRVELFVPYEFLHDQPFAVWAGAHKPGTAYYLLSWGREFNLLPVWTGTLREKQLLLYEVPRHELERVIKTQVTPPALPGPQKRKNP